MSWEIIGMSAGALTTASFLPQIVKTWKSKSAADFSWIWIVMMTSGVILWFIYGLYLNSMPLIIFNAITLLNLLVIAFIKRCHRPDRPKF